VELQARAREAVERCPYCHDVIVGAADLASELITCAGCGTQHHEACLLELGRCTVRGCEREIVVVRTPALEARLASRSPFYREVHRRISARARTFVHNNCRPPSDRHSVHPIDKIDAVLKAAHQARRDGRWLDAAVAFEEAERLILSIPALSSSARLSATAADARAFAVNMRSRGEGLISGKPISHAGRVALAVVGAMVLAMVVAAIFR
jgi:hypothetical protein